MTDFTVGDIIVYDSRASAGVQVELVGLVVGCDPEYRSNGKREWVYKILLYKDGKYDDLFTVTQTIARDMAFPIIGNLYPFKYGEPAITHYNDPSRSSNDGYCNI